MRYLLLVPLLLWSLSLSAQSLFEDVADKDLAEGASYELNGYLRGDLFLGKVPGNDEAEAKSQYAEAALKIRVRKYDFGYAFAEVRFRNGMEFGENLNEIDHREAYVSAYLGRFDVALGQQIVAWGRADGFNPTDNISPKNMLVRSPNEDDRRLGHFMIRSFLNLHPMRFEAIWIPTYAASVLPIDVIPFPTGITVGDPDYPDVRLKNSAFALKANLELADLDGSISYFNGYNPLPGISIGIVSLPSVILVPKTYRLHVLGADFATVVLNNTGLRGEFTYRQPHDDWEEHVHVPNPDLQYTIGLDREIFTDFTIILQYIGRYVFDYSELIEPANPADLPAYDVALKNRMISFQLDEISHAISFRPAWSLRYETLTVEALGLYNVTTEEIFIRPKISYDIADALTLTLGGDIYSGPDDTLFGAVDSALSALFLELKASF